MRASVYAGDLGWCEELQRVSTRDEEEEEDGIQTRAAVAFSPVRRARLDPIDGIPSAAIPAAASDQIRDMGNAVTPGPCKRACGSRDGRKAGGESSTSRLKLLLWCGTLRKQVSVRFRFVRTEQPRGGLTLAALATEGAEQPCDGAASANPIGFSTAVMGQVDRVFF